MWLAGPIAFLWVLAFVLPSFYYSLYPFTFVLDWLVVIGGTIAGTVVTHQQLGRNIEFGKALLPVLVILGGFSVLGFILNILNATDLSYFSYYLFDMFSQLVLKLVVSISVLLVTGAWYMFEKAGKPGWAILVPIYNLIVMCEIAEKPTWWVVLFLLPVANIVFLIIMLNEISKKFGKGPGFTVGMVFLQQIFFAILGYGDAQYMGATTPKNDDLLDNF